MIVGEDRVDLLVRILLDGAAGAVVGFAVAGGLVAEAIHGYVAVDQDDLELEDLVLVEVELFFQHFQLMDGPLGSRVFGGLGVYKGI